MADAKISALTNLTAADAINDMIPIVDVSDTPPASGNTKRISINNILSSSPTASGALTVTGLVTAGSATITGDLTVDTSTLKVDSTNNRVGVGTATPTQALHVRGNILTGSAAGTDSYVNVATDGVQNAYMGFNNSGSTNSSGASNNHQYVANGNGYPIQIATNGVSIATFSTAAVTITNGNVVMATSGKGIDFSATAGTGTSEILADYEEGTFTPTIGGTATYTAQTGTYTKVGRLVTASFDITILLRGTGDVAIVSGLPFAASANVGAAVAISYFSTLANSSASIYGYVNSSTMAFNTIAAGGGTSFSGAAVITNATRLAGTAVYMV